jgi:hypothetical protein
VGGWGIENPPVLRLTGMITEAVKQPAKPAIALSRPHQFLRQHLLKVISSFEDPQDETGRHPFGGERKRTGAFIPHLYRG